MNLANWADFATIIGVIALPVSAFGIWKQLREQTRLARAANTQALVELASPFNLQLIQDQKMAEYWVKGAELYPSYDSIDQYRYKSLLIWWLLLHENIFVQNQSDLLDPSIYSTWQKDLESFVHSKLEDHWPELRSTFQDAFVKHVDTILNQQ